VNADESRAVVSDRFFTCDGFRVGLRVGHAIFDAGHDFFFRKLSVFQPADFRTGKDGEAFHAALQKLLNGGIGKSNQSKHHGIRADRVELVVSGEGQNLIDDFGKKFNVRCLPMGNTGTQMGGWFNKELKEPADLKGVKMRIGGWAGKTLGKLGVVAQQIAGGDIYPALEKGTIDAVEWVGPYDDEKLGFYKVVKFYYYPGWWEGGTVLHLLINQAKFNELPKNYQAIVTAAAGFANVETTARYDARNPQALKRLVAAGTQLRPFSQSIMEACLKASNEVNAETSAVNADYKKVWDSIVAFRHDEYLWWQVAEYGYDSFMIRSRM
jgi:TRAP-type mannitol/chloroaromatic compound transport system substrate-binding protein